MNSSPFGFAPLGQNLNRVSLGPPNNLYGWGRFGNATQPSNLYGGFYPSIGPPASNAAAIAVNPSVGSNNASNIGTTTTSATTTVTVTAGVGASGAPAGGANANGTVVTINVGAGGTPSVGSVITINACAGSTVNIASGSGTSITLNQDGGNTTITLTSNPISGATSTPGIGSATSAAPASTKVPKVAATASTEVPKVAVPASGEVPKVADPASTAAPCSSFPKFPTPTVGQSSSTSSSSKIGPITSLPFEAQPIPEVTGDFFSHSASVSHQGRGSTVVPYTATSDADNCKFASISAMPIHKNKSHEVLRWEDYQSGYSRDKGVAVPGGGCPFGYSVPQTYLRNLSSLSERSTNLFAKPRPFAQTSSTPYGVQPSPGSSGMHSPNSLFKAELYSSLSAPHRSSSLSGPSSSSLPFSPPGSSILYDFAPYPVTFGDSNTFRPPSFGQTSSPNLSFTLPSQVHQPVSKIKLEHPDFSFPTDI